jgi:hypothetical protein
MKQSQSPASDQLELESINLRPVAVLSRETKQNDFRASSGQQKRPVWRPLQIDFRKDGLDYRQVAREGQVAIYELTWQGNTNAAAYEVVRIRAHDGFTVGGKVIEPAELYPRSESWGIDGFTFSDRAAADEKLRALCSKNEQPKATRQHGASKTEKTA